MCKQRLPLAIAAVTLAITGEIAANFAENANGAERVALCGIVALASGLAKLQSQKEAEPAEIEHVLKLNMTLADPEWRSIFVNPNKPTEVRPYPQAEFSKNADWATKWDKWKKKAEKNADGRQADQKAGVSQFKSRRHCSAAAATATSPRDS
ncbi:Trypanosomal VSG domain containing protein, putative [Trypanosoma equiperdum]|uniref:Trypanosomal VSG domain containing protein, putative n=1 Tax=Trypanosoma equiperdum TaxID=5694 RepID=A0A1G4IK22_TRYEQ|nr:Trypanosomal VSG domain containing protein, putative [Trypanosoma equiperdum]